jgi:hypothetical protein
LTFWPRADECQRRKFHYTTPAQFCQEFFIRQNAQIVFPECPPGAHSTSHKSALNLLCIIPSCNLRKICYNNKCKGDAPTEQGSKKKFKKSKKSLDKQKPMCYNKSVKGNNPYTIKNLFYKGVVTMTKMTKKEKFAIVRSIVETSNHANAEMLIEFIDHEVELLTRKNTSEKKPTAKQVANSVVQNEILNCMSVGEKYTVGELMKLVPALDGVSNQYASSQVRALVNAGSLVRTEEKRKAYFSLA